MEYGDIDQPSLTFPFWIWHPAENFLIQPLEMRSLYHMQYREAARTYCVYITFDRAISFTNGLPLNKSKIPNNQWYRLSWNEMNADLKRRESNYWAVKSERFHIYCQKFKAINWFMNITVLLNCLFVGILKTLKFWPGETNPIMVGLVICLPWCGMVWTKIQFWSKIWFALKTQGGD